MGNESSSGPAPDMKRTNSIRGSVSILDKVAQYDVACIRQAYERLRLSNLTQSEYVDAPTLIHCLPFPKHISETLVATFDLEDDQIINWKDCLGALVFCLHGYPLEKLTTLLELYSLSGQGLNRQRFRAFLTVVLLSVHTICKTTYAQENFKTDIDLDLTAYLGDVVEEICSEIFATKDIDKEAKRICLLMAKLTAMAVVIVTGDAETLNDGSLQSLQPVLDLTSLLAMAEERRRHSVLHQLGMGAHKISYQWHEVDNDRLHQANLGPPTRSKHAACAHGNHIYIQGGREGGIAHRDMWRYDTVQREWEKLLCTGDIPASLEEHTMVSRKGKLYVFGGQFTNADSETPLWVVELDKMKWTKITVNSEVVTPNSRRGHTAVVSHDAMHIYGGYVDLKGSSSELWTFDFDTGTWHLAYNSLICDDGPGGRHGHSAVAFDNTMWMYGGMTDLQARDDLWRWDFVAHCWNKIRTRHGPPPLKGHTASRVECNMLIYGGATGEELSKDLWIFNLESQIWSRSPTCDGSPSGRYRHAAVITLEIKCTCENDAARSRSVPLLRNNKVEPASSWDMQPEQQQERPYSSPAYISSGESIPMKVFRSNRISPGRTRGGESMEEEEDSLMAVSAFERENQSDGCATNTRPSESACGAGGQSFQFPDENDNEKEKENSETGSGTAASGRRAHQGASCPRQPHWASMGSISQRSDEVPLMLYSQRSLTVDSLDSLLSKPGLENPGYMQDTRGHFVKVLHDRHRNTVNDEDRHTSPPKKKTKQRPDVRRDAKENKAVYSLNGILPSAKDGLPPKSGPSASDVKTVRRGTSRTLSQQSSLSTSADSVLQEPDIMTCHLASDNNQVRSRSFSQNDLLLEDIEDMELDDNPGPSPSRKAAPKPTSRSREERSASKGLRTGLDHSLPARENETNSSQNKNGAGAQYRTVTPHVIDPIAQNPLPSVSGNSASVCRVSQETSFVPSSGLLPSETNVKERSRKANLSSASSSMWEDPPPDYFAVIHSPSLTSDASGFEEQGTHKNYRFTGPSGKGGSESDWDDADTQIKTPNRAEKPRLPACALHCGTVSTGAASRQAMAAIVSQNANRQYAMYILGGKTTESRTFFRKPLSMWRLEIKTGASPRTGKR